jgi:hypothetical protein
MPRKMDATLVRSLALASNHKHGTHILKRKTFRLTVWVEHFRNKAHSWRLVWVVFSELQSQLECASVPWSIIRPEDDSVPQHDIVILRCPADSCRWIMLQTLKVSH